MTATPARAIKGILALQILIGAALVAGDMSFGVPGLPGGGRAPGMEQPVRPGDQTRRYEPGALPERPNTPFPRTGDMPERLTLEEVELAGRSVLRMVGTVAPGDGARIPDLLAERIAARDPAPTLALHSPGGSVNDALEIGRAIRALDLATRVTAGGVCLSACPYILAGGTRRSVSPDGSVGVHQHAFGESTVLPAFLAVEDVQRGQGRVMEYLAEMGVDPLLMRHALATPPDSIYLLLPEELDRYRLSSPPEE